MTKLRAPLSFALAVTRIAGVIGWAVAARVANRSERTIRLWSESDNKTTPTLEQAVKLDAAYRFAGGDGAPLLECYTLMLEIRMAGASACQAALVNDIATLTRETADAVATSLQVIQPGATPTAIYRAIAEAEDAAGAGSRLLARLKSFLPGNGAVFVKSGENHEKA